MSGWWIVGVVAALVLAAVLWPIRSELKKIGRALRDAVRDVYVAVAAAVLTAAGVIARQSWTVWCLLYISRWRIGFLFRRFFRDTQLGVLLLGAAWAFLDVTLVWLGRLVREASDETGPQVAQTQTTAIVDRLTSAPWPHLPELPFPLEAAVVALAVLMIRHYVHEWKLRRLEMKLPEIVENLLLDFHKTSAAASGAAITGFIDSLFDKMKSALDHVSNRGLVLSLMEKEASSGLLATTFWHPNSAKFDRNVKLRPGEGAAGAAYDKKEAVYVPSVTHEIALTDLDSGSFLSSDIRYKKHSDNDDEFKSILCIPVRTDAGVVGVLNIVSTKRGAFGPLDLKIGKLTAGFVSILR
jgi:hypothetical protein